MIRLMSNTVNSRFDDGTERRWRRLPASAVLLSSLLFSSLTSAQSVRDNFSTVSYSNNDGTANWTAAWIENDVQGAGPGGGNVLINGGDLLLDDQPNTNTEPSLAREANLLGATIATLNFDWRTTSGVDNSDSVVVEVSGNGGASWTTLENFTNLNGVNSGSRSFDITSFAAVDTQIRFRVNNLYGGGNEDFILDYVEIAYIIVLSGTDLSLTQSDTPDPVNVASPLSYSLLATNNGPDDASGVTVIDTLPAGTTFQSASATQGSCTELAGIVTCVLGDLAATDSATINIALTAPFTTGTIANAAVISGNESDPFSANDASSENTFVQNLNVNQLCYLVADSGGGGGGDDLFTSIDTADFDPASNETNFGIGTGTNGIEAVAYNSATGIVYAANGGQLGILNTTSGVFQALPQNFGTGSGSIGNISFSNIDGLTYDAIIDWLMTEEKRESEI